MKARSFRIFDRAALHRVSGLLSQMLVSEEHPLLIEVSAYKEKKTRSQENLFHGILEDVAANLEVDGKRFSKTAWKEHYARKFLPLHDVTLPTGEIIQQRQSTKDLNVGEYSELIDKTLSDLASEFGYLAEMVA